MINQKQRYINKKISCDKILIFDDSKLYSFLLSHFTYDKNFL